MKAEVVNPYAKRYGLIVDVDPVAGAGEAYITTDEDEINYGRDDLDFIEEKAKRYADTTMLTVNHRYDAFEAYLDGYEEGLSKSHWKPSEEQMEALNALNCHGDLSYVGQQNQLISLYNDLKKLM